jgi:hypothetical protein
MEILRERDALERARDGVPVEKGRRRDSLHRGMAETHEPIGLVVGKGPQGDPAHHREDGRAGADAEGEREDRQAHEDRRAPEGAHGHPDVADDVADPFRSTDADRLARWKCVEVVPRFAYAAGACGESLQRFCPRFRLGDTLSHELLDPHIDVKADFLVGLLAKRLGCVQREPKRAPPAAHVVRRAVGATVRMSVTASA